MTKHSSKKHLVDLSNDLAKIRDAFAETAIDVKNKASEAFSQSVEDVKDKSTDFKDNIEAFVAEKPFKSLLLAMLSGAFLGAFMRRGRRISSRHRE